MENPKQNTKLQPSQTLNGCGIDKFGWYLGQKGSLFEHKGQSFVAVSLVTLFLDQEPILFFHSGKPISKELERIVKYLPEADYPEMYL